MKKINDEMIAKLQKEIMENGTITVNGRVIEQGREWNEKRKSWKYFNSYMADDGHNIRVFRKLANAVKFVNR